MLAAVLRQVWWFLKTISATISYVAYVVGVLYLWPDIVGLPEVFGLSWDWPMWLDQDKALYAGLVVAGLWIFSMDVRPTIKSWLEKRRAAAPPAFQIAEHVYCETRSFGEARGTVDARLYLNTFYLAVGSRLEPAQTLKRVQARIYHIDPPTLCAVKDQPDGETDIRHGEWAYFEIGRLVSPKTMGLFRGKADIEDRFLKMYRHNIPLGGLSFEICSVSSGREYGLHYSAEMATVWKLLMVISADNVRATNVEIAVDMSKEEGEPVSFKVLP